MQRTEAQRSSPQDPSPASGPTGARIWSLRVADDGSHQLDALGDLAEESFVDVVYDGINDGSRRCQQPQGFGLGLCWASIAWTRWFRDRSRRTWLIQQRPDKPLRKPGFAWDTSTHRASQPRVTVQDPAAWSAEGAARDRTYVQLPLLPVPAPSGQPIFSMLWRNGLLWFLLPQTDDMWHTFASRLARQCAFSLSSICAYLVTHQCMSVPILECVTIGCKDIVFLHLTIRNTVQKENRQRNNIVLAEISASIPKAAESPHRQFKGVFHCASGPNVDSQNEHSPSFRTPTRSQEEMVDE